MRRTGLLLAGLLFCCGPALAQSGAELLLQQLKQDKSERQEGKEKFMADFFSQLETAEGSPDAALDLYKSAGGKMPDAAPVETQYEHETPDEKADREARDQANQSNLAYVAQLHCGMMRFGALFVTKPDTKGLHDDWVAWLKNAAQIYAQIKTNNPPPPSPDSNPDSNSSEHHGHRNNPAPPASPPPSVATDFKGTSMHDSVISSYLGFHGWGEKDQGSWSVGKLPELYRTEVLDPLRTHPNADTLAAWDVYISMKQVDEPDPDKWTQVDLPSLTFDRTCDVYAGAPSMENLQAVVQMVLNNPDHPKHDDMNARATQLVSDYLARHPGASFAHAPAPSTPATPTESVTTTTVGDMTVVTTHPISTPATNAPPTQGQ